MASLRPGITEEEFRAIFGYSDDEDNLEDRNNDDVDSDLDFEGLEPVPESSDSEESDGEESESEDEERLEAEETWTDKLSAYDIPEFSHPAGLLVDLGNDPKADDMFFFIFGEETLQNIVAETNRYAKQQLANKAERLARWKDITAVELKAYFGICVLMGINTLPKMADYWSTDPCLANTVIKSVMARNRFQEITQFLHFNDSTKTPPRGGANYDRLYKIRPIINAVLKNSQRCYSPKKAIAVDEGMIAFKGRLSFRQYMPAKPTKYGIKVWMAADSTNGYVMNFEIYMGSSEKLVHGLGYNVVMNMVKPYLNRNHRVYFDNFFSSTRLLEHLQSQDTYACSTVRVNRKDLPPCTTTKLRQGELVQAQKGKILFTKWHDKRDVSFLSTTVSPTAPSRLVPRSKKNVNFEIPKPRVSDDYTQNMGGVDRADQLRSYYYVGRQSRKWYKYIFWFFFNLSACNSYVLECERRGRSKRPQVEFRLELAKRLINGYCSRKRAHNEANAAVPEHLPSHTIAPIDGRKKQCVQCKTAGRKTHKGYPVETKTKCKQCSVSLCKERCFRDYHAPS